MSSPALVRYTRMMGGLRVFGSIIFVVACNANDPCGPPAGEIDLSGGADLELDVSGESNADCMLTVSRGSSSVVAQIAAPSPSVDDMPSDRARFYFERACAGGAGADRVGHSVATGIGDTKLDARMHHALEGRHAGSWFSKPVDDCAVSISLTCGGVTLYDHVSEELCQIMC